MYGQLYDAVKREDEGAVRDLLKKATAWEVNFSDDVSNHCQQPNLSILLCTILHTFIQSSINLNKTSLVQVGRTALMLASAEGSSKIVKMLLNHKDIDPNVQCAVSGTSLRYD